MPGPFRKGDNFKKKKQKLGVIMKNAWARRSGISCMLPDTKWFKVCSNYGPQGSGGPSQATIRKTIVTCVYIEKKVPPELAGQFQSNFIQIIFA
jgi:hypothetical protein